MCHWTLSSVNAITSYNTSDNSVHFHPSKEFWIWCPNRQKILQSLHIILKNKNRFDGSQKVENSCNYCNDHFKTKFVFIHHKMSQHVVNCNLAIIVSFTTTRFILSMQFPFNIVHNQVLVLRSLIHGSKAELNELFIIRELVQLL